MRWPVYYSVVISTPTGSYLLWPHSFFKELSNSTEGNKQNPVSLEEACALRKEALCNVKICISPLKMVTSQEFDWQK